MAKKLFYSMGEVSEMFDVNASLIRFWETKFDILRPQKNKKGNRLFSPADVENLKLIYHLVKERGMTLDGAARCLKQNKGTISRDAELLERLQRVRALLEEVRAELKESAEDRAVVAENGAGEAAEVSALPVRTRKKPAAQELADDAGGDGAESKGPVQVIEPGPRSEKPAPKRSAARQPRRKKEKEEAESKELFAYGDRPDRVCERTRYFGISFGARSAASPFEVRISGWAALWTGAQAANKRPSDMVR